MSIRDDALNTLRELKEELRATGKPMTEEQRAKEAEAVAIITRCKEEERLDKAIAEIDAMAEEKREEQFRASATVVSTADDKQDAYREEFRSWLKSKSVDMRAVTDFQNEGTSADGGYLAPNDFYANIIKKRDALSVVRKVATVLNIDRSLNLPVEGTDLSVEWLAEGATPNLTKQAFVQKTLTLRKLSGTVGITEELMDDSAIDIEAYVYDKLSRKFVQAEDDAFINGTAANNKPVGILQSGITTTRTASASAVTADEVMEFFGSLGEEYANYGSWIISPAFRTALMKMTTGTGGNYIWQPSMRDDVPDMILGKPAYVSGYVGDSIAASKFLAIFGDLSYYYIGDKAGISMTKYDTRITNGAWTLRAVERTSGVLTDSNAVKILQCKAS